MITKLIKPCPFCGGKVEIQIRDAEGNLRDEEYEKDPWSGLTYSIGHYTGDNPNCPIATYKEDIVGVYLYESKNEAIEAWNRRIKQERKSHIKMSKFEFDLLKSYINISGKRDGIFCTTPLLQRMFVLGYFVNVHPQLTLNEILERAVIVDESESD